MGWFGVKDGSISRDGLTLGPDGFHVDREWSADEFRQLQARVIERRSHGYYQQINITDRAKQTITTPGTHLTNGVMPLLEGVGFPKRLDGKSVLDIGCNAGFYSLSAWMRGARRVVGLDQQPHYINQALMVRDILGLSADAVEFRVADGHDLSEDSEHFDVVINTGVVYHLQNPMDFLSKVSKITTETMILESEMLIDPAYAEYAWFIEGEYGGDISNWWIYGPTCLERMARASGFREVTFSGFIWKPERGTRVPEGMLRQGRGVLICRK
jgi:2-polyprenyl-3-methyl-5-hydroxy-6-metoxy-1,4-benzoquinol methylase